MRSLLHCSSPWRTNQLSVFLWQRPAVEILSRAIKKALGMISSGFVWYYSFAFFKKVIHWQWELPGEQFREESTNFWVFLVHAAFNRHKLSTPKSREKIYQIVNIRYFITSPHLCQAHLFGWLIDLCRSDSVSAEQWKGNPAAVTRLPS